MTVVSRGFGFMRGLNDMIILTPQYAITGSAPVKFNKFEGIKHTLFNSVNMRASSQKPHNA